MDKNPDLRGILKSSKEILLKSAISLHSWLRQSKMQALGQVLGVGNFSDRKFRFQAEKGHFTFPGHIDFDIIINKAIEVGGGDQTSVMRISLVHELGADTEAGLSAEDHRRYEHTHAAIQWTKIIDRRNCRFMDVQWEGNEVHPNIQVKKADDWFQGLFYDYHRGKKANKSGGYTITEPPQFPGYANPWQAGMAGWETHREVMENTVRAPNLIEACLIAGVKPKSVMDVETLRKAVKRKSCEKALASCDKPWRDPPDDWIRETQSLLIVGGSNAGKSNYAIHLMGPDAFVIRAEENLKNVPQHATGLVFDDQEYAGWNLQDQKMICDCRVATTIHKGVNTAKDKPHLPAVFTSNDKWKLLSLHDGAIQTRTYLWEIPDGEKMYV